MLSLLLENRFGGIYYVTSVRFVTTDGHSHHLSDDLKLVLDQSKTCSENLQWCVNFQRRCAVAVFAIELVATIDIFQSAMRNVIHFKI